MPGKLKEEFIVKKDGLDYNVSRFLHFHPGGKNNLSYFKDKNIDQKMLEVNHSPAALYIMRDFKKEAGLKAKTEPEDLETLVDWSKPMRDQVGALGEKYWDWTFSPVDRKLRLFESDFMEMLSIAPWYLVVSVWVPIMCALFYHGYFVQNSGQLSTPATLGSLIIGVLSWSIVEYTLHRWLFHRVPSLKSPQDITFHFTLHGLHHKVPYDDNRLLFPPAPAMVIGLIIYFLSLLIVPRWMVSIYVSGISLGYLLYDLTHFFLHFGSPKPNTFLHHMKRYHNRHHFTHQDTGYGVTSVFWDRLLNTEIHLPKLTRTLRW